MHSAIYSGMGARRLPLAGLLALFAVAWPGFPFLQEARSETAQAFSPAATERSSLVEPSIATQLVGAD